MPRHARIERNSLQIDLPRKNHGGPSWLGERLTSRQAARDRSPAAGLRSVPFSFADVPVFPANPAVPIQAFSDVHRGDDRFEREAHSVADQLDAGGSDKLGSRIHPVSAGQAGLKGVHPSIEASIKGARGGGSSMPEWLSRPIGERLGADLGRVRVHTDARADRLNRQLHSRAFTTGTDIFFRRGEYNPHSPKVLKHELTHVVQQCGKGGEPGLQAPAQAPIQRFILQIGQNDDYTKEMRDSLKSDYPSEDYRLSFALWDMKPKQNEEDPDEYYESYAPMKTVTTRPFPFNKEVRVQRPDTPLANLGKRETLRIVAHGSQASLVGGYSADAMAVMLRRIGLKSKHTGGIDIHACLPASKTSYEDANGKVQKRKPYIVQLQKILKDSGIKTVVRGYEHCIVPRKYFNPYEVKASAYTLFNQVYKPIAKSSGTPKLTTEQREIMIEHMKDDAKPFLTGRKPQHEFIAELDQWMTAKGFKIGQARLRRADSVDT